jgi:hypothetical protein
MHSDIMALENVMRMSWGVSLKFKICAKVESCFLSFVEGHLDSEAEPGFCLPL